MKIHKPLKLICLAAIILVSTAISCNKSKDEAESFRFNGANMKEQYVTTDQAELEILNFENKKVDSVIYYVNNEKVGSKKGLGKIILDLNDRKFGYQQLKALVYFEGKSVEVTERIEVVSNVEAKILKYTVLNTYNHDLMGFTQGLEFFRDTLIESTGQ